LLSAIADSWELRAPGRCGAKNDKVYNTRKGAIPHLALKFQNTCSGKSVQSFETPGPKTARLVPEKKIPRREVGTPSLREEQRQSGPSSHPLRHYISRQLRKAVLLDCPCFLPWQRLSRKVPVAAGYSLPVTRRSIRAGPMVILTQTLAFFGEKWVSQPSSAKNLGCAGNYHTLRGFTMRYNAVPVSFSLRKRNFSSK
jgi:hypothetical protein